MNKAPSEPTGSGRAPGQSQDALAGALSALDAAPVPADVRLRLLSARTRAVAAGGSRGRRRTGRRAGFELPRFDWAPAATAFASLAMTVLLISLDRDGASLTPPNVAADPGAAVYVYAGDDADLIEELDFVRWLETREHPG